MNITPQEAKVIAGFLKGYQRCLAYIILEHEPSDAILDLLSAEHDKVHILRNRLKEMQSA